MSRNLATLGLESPAPDAPKPVRLRFIRDLQIRALPFNLLGLAVLFAAGMRGWPLVAVVVAIGALVLDIAWLSFRLRRGGAQ